MNIDTEQRKHELCDVRGISKKEEKVTKPNDNFTFFFFSEKDDAW